MPSKLSLPRLIEKPCMEVNAKKIYDVISTNCLISNTLHDSHVFIKRSEYLYTDSMEEIKRSACKMMLF